MQKLTRIQKYELERNRLEDIAKMVNDKKKEITFNKTYRTGPTPERPADKCVAWTFLEYESDCDWEGLYVTVPSVEYCPEYERGCKNEKCPTYQKYLDYLAAKKYFEDEGHKLMNYPLWVMIAARIKRKFGKAR